MRHNKRKQHLRTPYQVSNLNLPVISSLVWCEGGALYQAATELANAFVVLSSTAEDGESEVRTSVGSTRCGITTIKLANALVVLSSTAEDGEIEIRISRTLNLTGLILSPHEGQLISRYDKSPLLLPHFK
uniref:(California timema) hypothetical protein n=1 Tax=Timema californicum TaxID=61474 RepID=A0A7R9IWN4_TIMCA|nr:unnamed protein product [Timema californicum]